MAANMFQNGFPRDFNALKNIPHLLEAIFSFYTAVLWTPAPWTKTDIPKHKNDLNLLNICKTVQGNEKYYLPVKPIPYIHNVLGS